MRCGLVSCYFTWGRAKAPPKPFEPTFSAEAMSYGLLGGAFQNMNQLARQQQAEQLAAMRGQQFSQQQQQQQQQAQFGGGLGLGNILGGL